MISSNIRVPEDLWEELKKIANKEERSINAQLIYIIKKYIEENTISKWKLKDFLANNRVSKISEVILHKMLAPKIGYILFVKLFSFLN